MNTKIITKKIIAITKLLGGISIIFFSLTAGVSAGSASGSVTVNVAADSDKNLTLLMAGTGSGTLTGAGAYVSGATATARAVANKNSTFTGWSGDCSGLTDNTLTMDADKSCTATFVKMTGWISPSTPSCIIPSGESTCDVTLSWGTKNPVATSAITASGMSDVSGNNNAGKVFPVPYSSRIFFLYNNSIELDQVTAMSSCITGTAWDGSKCSFSTMSVVMSAVPASVSYGGSSMVTWKATGADSCTSPFAASKATEFSFATGALYADQTYTVECTNGGGKVSANTTVQVASRPGPTVSVFAEPVVVDYGASAKITWTSTNADSCSSAGGGGTGAFGSFNTPGLYSDTKYTVTCTGNGSKSDFVIVTVRGPSVTVTANPETVLYKGESTISWTSTNATSCSSVSTGSTATAGSFLTGPLTGTDTPSTAKVYKVTCVGNGSATGTATVNVCAQRYTDAASCTKQKLKPIYKEL